MNAIASPSPQYARRAVLWLNYLRVAAFLVVSFALLPLIARLVGTPSTVRPAPSGAELHRAG
ncbi:hypothetical protein [Saccharopolyspora sp. NPDC002376]